MSILEITDKDLPFYVARLFDIILEENPMHKSFLKNALMHAHDDELAMLSDYLDFCEKKGHELNYIAESYLTFVTDTMREQLYFMKHKEYRHKSYADVAGHVYHDNDYMDKYMYGLAITSFFWPIHLEMGRLFVDTLPRHQDGKYLEIGPGHGYYMMKAMQLSSFDKYLGIDISETSIKQTQEIIDHFKPEYKEKYELKRMDFLEAKELEKNSFDAIIMGEVLEHVEQPEVFLKRIAELAKDDAYIYVTTCLNAPAIDHIYLWRTTDELEKMIEGCNLRIKTPLRLPYEGKTLEQAEKENLSINVAYILEKAS